MVNPLKKKLVPIKELQDVRGVQLPAGLTFIQLVVTGPPGSGKTYYINKIHGWPNEGYIDLTRKGWWKDRSLTYRPREIHLGLPFKGFTEALTVFDQEWLEAPEPLQLELERIQIPPVSSNFFQTNWRNRYVFEFLLPKAETIFKQRQLRHTEGYFPVDEELSLEIVKRQLAVYKEIVLYLHREKMQVYVRESLDKPPMRIVEKKDVGIPVWATATSLLRPSLGTLAGWNWLIFRRHPINWITLSNQWQTIGGESRVAYDGKGFEMKLGRQNLCFHPEIQIGVKKKNLLKNWIITDPATVEENIYGFAMIKRGETVTIGRANDAYNMLFHFPKSVLKRHVHIRSEKGDLIITPLDEEREVKVIRSEDRVREKEIEARRYKAIVEIRDIYGGPIDLLQADDAMKLLQDVNQILANETYRRKNSSGLPGGLIELPETITPVIAGDLHAQVDNLLEILCRNNTLDCLARKKACLIILGDAVHSEIAGEMEIMDSSILMMDLIFSIKCRFPDNFFYIRGNHDGFDPDISKNGISQGVLMRRRLLELRGEAYVKEMQTFYDRLPLVILSESFVACHAAPPMKNISKMDLVNLDAHPQVARELLTGRLKRPTVLTGYGKSDVKQFRKNLALAKQTPFIVGHTPVDQSNSVWKNVGEIKGHHIIYSGRLTGPALFVQLDKRMIPLNYPAEPLIKIIGKLP
ncbi:MAG: serine/threonine protein phosphatase [Desulfobulbaceae bacterium]|nr:serine/threonine protein phosphatase [Desulfobulbaceae bacterium]